MSFELFILVFFAIVFLGSLAVTGWFFITRGEIKVMENGLEKRAGKIFKNWYFFWTQKKDAPHKVFFNEPTLFKFFQEIKGKFVVSRDISDIQQVAATLVITSPEKYREEMRWIEMGYDVKFYEMGMNHFMVYKEYDNFLFPYWLRDPLAVCATCFSSIYGSIFYWLLIALVKKPIFGWSSSPVVASICFWIAFCLSLSVVNTALAKRFN